MRFQHFTHLRLEEDLGHIFSTPDRSIQFERTMDHDRSGAAERRIEGIFEQVRLEEYPASPSRLSCIFLFEFGLDPDKYAASMSFIQVRRELTLVEVETQNDDLHIVRVDKSLLSRRRDSKGELNATDEEIMSDAREYWAGTTKSDYDVEILFCGKFIFTRIIRMADQPLDTFSFRERLARACDAKN